MAIQCCFERYEKKYCLTLSQQRFLLERMMPYMKKDEYGEYTICNIYYDTDDFRLIRASLEKPVYKEKLRVRSYGVPQADGRVFVELKKKFDGVVYKVARYGRQPSPRQPRCTHRAALRRCADGGQNSRHVPAVALPSTLRRRGVPRVVFQIRCLLP